MKIEGTPKVMVVNNILSGYYVQNAHRGIRPKLFEFSSPTYPIYNFQAPYDAYLPGKATDGQLVVAAANRVRNLQDPIQSNVSGKLYYYDGSDLYGVCHGFGRTAMSHYSGMNYYQAFYPAGYFAPPYGENYSIFLGNDQGSDNLNNGACASLSITEYNEQIGITSKGASDVGIMTDSLNPNGLAPIFSPRGVCPSDATVGNYYEEINFKQIQGTSQAIGAGTFYNNNPIPTSLDGYRIQLANKGRYVIDDDGHGNRTIRFTSGKPIPSYSYAEAITDANNILCPATIMETDVLAGKGTNGIQLVEAPDILFANGSPETASQVFVNQGLDTHFYYWHFLYRENAASLPFSNGNIFNPNNQENVYHRGIGEDTQLFDAKLSSPDYFWQNRQCADTVDFLPWTFGASIYACPSEHFDIPYYAATKKFGFYGTRFLNTCNKIDLSYTVSGVEKASELPEGTSYPLAQGENEPEGLDIEGSWTFSAYDNLLKTAAAEERYSNMYALNRGFFLWANSPFVLTDDRYLALKLISGFEPAYLGMVNKFQSIFTGGLMSFISGEPVIVMKDGLAGATYTTDTQNYSNLLFTNEAHTQLILKLKDVLPADSWSLWNDLENSYAYYITDGIGVNNEFYNNIVSGREKRLLTRYMENTVKGNPIDLFPLNHIYFSFDSGRELLEHTGWGRAITALPKNHIPSVSRRYFEGAYGQASAVTGLTQVLSQLQNINDSSFYPGFFNNWHATKDIPSPTYTPVLSGVIIDEKKRSWNPSGWLALGYNEVGQLDNNFSCFTPIFIQNPVPKVFTKIGQAPTFRALAVDYHSIPDDKISMRYPEILYWAHKLKLVDKNFKNLYPIKYKWIRVPKTQYANFLASGDLSQASYSHPTGEWSCLEGDSSTCTVIHPLECLPTGTLNRQSSYTFMKGAKAGIDDQYYYIALASGRFGVRMSEKSELQIEDWVRFDVSFKNGMNASSEFSIDFIVNDTGNNNQTITFTSDNVNAYLGYQRDKHAIPEAVIEQKVPPPNAGFGDVTAFRFVGPIGYVGATRSWQPDTLMDTRGVRGAWGRFIEYGRLIPFSKNISQREGDLLYGYKHLPTCNNYQMSAGQKGIRVEAKFAGGIISHWSLAQQAVAAMDSSAGMKYDRLDNLGGLYPPVTKPILNTDKNGKVDWTRPGSDPIIGGYGIGHWQWGNNFGSIKRFGILSSEDSEDIVFVGKGSSSQGNTATIETLKKNLIKPSTLAGENCGYTPYGLGRNMVYYIEAYGRFYHLCDLLKKKNVKNLSFMCPGLRSTNSAIQYFWLGHPTNTYVERRPMYGPYAYQWRVRRHNRDRNGNGISEGFYSMGWDDRYSLMYDAPAIFGLYVKKDASISYKGAVQDTISIRQQAFPNGISVVDLRNQWFGIGRGEGSERTYGNFFCGSQQTGVLCDYISKAQSLSVNPDFAAYSCPPEVLAKGECFDPCISMRYSHGFFPGGKQQNMFGYNQQSDNTAPKNIRLVASASLDNQGKVITHDESSVVDKNTLFRSPVNTPHARITRGLKSVKDYLRPRQDVFGVSPCQDGGSDHCNFMTPTIHLHTSSMILSKTTAFLAAKNYAANLYESYNIRGDVS